MRDGLGRQEWEVYLAIFGCAISLVSCIFILLTYILLHHRLFRHASRGAQFHRAAFLILVILATFALISTKITGALLPEDDTTEVEAALSELMKRHRIEAEAKGEDPEANLPTEELRSFFTDFFYSLESRHLPICITQTLVLVFCENALCVWSVAVSFNIFLMSTPGGTSYPKLAHNLPMLFMVFGFGLPGLLAFVTFLQRDGIVKMGPYCWIGDRHNVLRYFMGFHMFLIGFIANAILLILSALNLYRHHADRTGVASSHNQQRRKKLRKYLSYMAVFFLCWLTGLAVQGRRLCINDSIVLRVVHSFIKSTYVMWLALAFAYTSNVVQLYTNWRRAVIKTQVYEGDKLARFLVVRVPKGPNCPTDCPSGHACQTKGWWPSLKRRRISPSHSARFNRPDSQPSTPTTPLYVDDREKPKDMRKSHASSSGTSSSESTPSLGRNKFIEDPTQSPPPPIPTPLPNAAVNQERLSRGPSLRVAKLQWDLDIDLDHESGQRIGDATLERRLQASPLPPHLRPSSPSGANLSRTNSWMRTSVASVEKLEAHRETPADHTFYPRSLPRSSSVSQHSTRPNQPHVDDEMVMRAMTTNGHERPRYGGSHGRAAPRRHPLRTPMSPFSDTSEEMAPPKSYSPSLLPQPPPSQPLISPQHSESPPLSQRTLESVPPRRPPRSPRPPRPKNPYLQTIERSSPPSIAFQFPSPTQALPPTNSNPFMTGSSPESSSMSNASGRPPSADPLLPPSPPRIWPHHSFDQ